MTDLAKMRRRSLRKRRWKGREKLEKVRKERDDDANKEREGIPWSGRVCCYCYEASC